MAKAASRPTTIALNRRARFDYELGQRFEAGIALVGWELKSIRANQAQLTDSYVHVRDGEAWLLGAHFAPLQSASTHVEADPRRTRKLLLHAEEISRIFMAVQTKGQSCVATALYWKGRHVKCEVALGKGKRSQDKRAAIRERDWKREQARLAKQAVD
ncbi:MAG: SsrA-binding protein SmpB [Pseudomonadales bacterium]|nr:SsrA-binding protein SmpB [Pseudomonadales bacterium]